MAAARFPPAQALVHEELATVVGLENRMQLNLLYSNDALSCLAAPTFEDFPRLVQLQAFILEALRWRPVNPIGEPKTHLKISTNHLFTDLRFSTPRNERYRLGIYCIKPCDVV